MEPRAPGPTVSFSHWLKRLLDTPIPRNTGKIRKIKGNLLFFISGPDFKFTNSDPEKLTCVMQNALPE